MPSTAHRVAPGPRGHYLVGNVPELRDDPLRLFIECGLEFGDVVRLHLGPITAHLVRHPDGVKHVLQDNNKNYGRQTRGFEALRETLGNGLITSEGSFWQRQRRIAQPGFHRQRIAGFAAIMVESATAMVERWAARGASAGQPDRIDLTPELLRVTLRILGLSMFGLDLSDDAEAIGRAVTVVLEATRTSITSILEIPRFIPTPANRRFLEALATIDRVTLGLIAERRAGGASKDDLLSMLLDARDEETGEGMTDRQLRDELVTILGAGHETTSMALSWTAVLLSRHPGVRRKLEAELDVVLAGRAPGFSDIPKLQYTRMVLEEAMRLYPPAWIVGRNAIDDDEIGGYPIPAASLVFVSPWVTHRHPGLWDNPEGFDPERFAPGADEARPRYAYFPFGGGPHLCIGNSFAMMEATLVLATVAQRFHMDLVPGHPVEPEPMITIRPRHGVMVSLRRR
jgi:cytochrome P450